MDFVLKPWSFLLVTLAGWINRQQLEVIEYLKEENRVLKDRLGGKRIRFTDKERRRLAVRAKALGRQALHELETLVTPNTLLGWHRRLVAKKYDGSARRGPGRPVTPGEIRRLVIDMATDNRTWGYTRIVGALRNLGHNIARTTVANILCQAGLEPAPERIHKTSWTEFIRAHWEVLAACDFFTVEVWGLAGLVRHHVFFVIHLSTRQVEIAGISSDANGKWMAQIARNLTDCMGGFLLNARYLIHDRDPLFTTHFGAILKTADVDAIRLPAKSPNLNAFAERFVLSIKSECLNRMVFFSQTQLRHAIGEYVAHYHLERNHQGLGNRLLTQQLAANTDGEIVCHRRLGGMLRYYHRRAA